MSDSINLLIKDQKPKASEAQGLTIFRWIALGSFGVTLLASVILFLLVIFSPLSSLLKEKDNLVSQLSASSDKITTLLGLQDRLTNIATIMSTRPPYDTLMAELKDQIPPDADVEAVKMAGKKITFGVSSSSLASLDQYITNVLALNNKSKRIFRTISLTSIAYSSQSQKYTLTTDMTMF